MQSKRLLELDGIRGIAALMVVFYHYFYRYNEIYGHKDLPTEWISSGDIGVQLFFIVSGFVIYWSLNKIKNPFDFIVSRFSRLYPAYWICALFTFSVICFFGLDGREVSFQEALLNILMFHQYLGIKHIDGVYWTLTIELTFYFWMFSFYLFGILKYVEKIFSVICIIGIIHYLGYFTIPKTISYLFLLDQIPFFLAGICFYKINSNLASKSTYFILFISLFSAIITDINHLLIYCLFYMVFILAIRKHLTVLKNKVCLFFGGISYSLYLIHQNFGYIIINYAYENNISPWLAIIVALTASTFLAYIVTDFFEKPILISIRNIYSRHQSQSKKTEALL